MINDVTLLEVGKLYKPIFLPNPTGILLYLYKPVKEEATERLNLEKNLKLKIDKLKTELRTTFEQAGLNATNISTFKLNGLTYRNALNKLNKEKVFEEYENICTELYMPLCMIGSADNWKVIQIIKQPEDKRKRTVKIQTTINEVYYLGWLFENNDRRSHIWETVSFEELI